MDVSQQSFGGLIRANLKPFRVIRPGGDLQHILHVANESSTRLWRDKVLFFHPRFKFIFLSVVRMVSCETQLMNPNLTNRSRKSHNIQR